MDVRNPLAPTEPAMQAAFKAGDVEYFKQAFENCNEDKLALIQQFTQLAASTAWTKQQEWLSSAGKYEDIMIAGLKRLVALSDAKTGLRSGGLDLNLCLRVINNFYSLSNIKEMLTYQRYKCKHLEPTLLYFLNCLELNPPLCSYTKIDKAIKALEEEYFAKEIAAEKSSLLIFYPNWYSRLIADDDVNMVRNLFMFHGIKHAESLFERSHNFCSVQKVESMFVGVELGGLYRDDFSSMSLLLFKSLYKRALLVGESAEEKLARTCWNALHCNRVDIAKFLSQGNALNFVGVISLIDAIRPAPFQNGPDVNIAKLYLIVENNLTDLDGLEALSGYLSGKPDMKSCELYLNLQIDRINKQADVMKKQAAVITLLGLKRFGLLPAPKNTCLDRGVVKIIARMVNRAEWPPSKPARNP